MSFEPYLCLAGTEIGNAQRVLAYVRRGLAGSRWRSEDEVSFGLTNPLLGEYVDEYLDVYLGGGEENVQSEVTRSSSCPCPGLGVLADYVSPATDPAPWYEAVRESESGDFLGFLPDLVDVLPVAVRSIQSRGDFGGVLGRIRRRHRVIQVSGVMLATSRRGMSWGERWLSEALVGSYCEPLRGDIAEVLPACPPDGTSDGDAEDWLRQLYGVGLVDGPIFAAEGEVPRCFLQRASFQLVAANPFLHTPPDALLEAETVTAGSPASVQVDTEEWLSGAAVFVELAAVTETTNVVVTAVPMTEGQACPATGVVPCVWYSVPLLNAGDTLTIDAIERAVTLVDASSKTGTSGFPLLDIEGPFAWIEVPPCTSMCVTVEVGAGSAEVSISVANREL